MISQYEIFYEVIAKELETRNSKLRILPFCRIKSSTAYILCRLGFARLPSWQSYEDFIIAKRRISKLN